MSVCPVSSESGQKSLLPQPDLTVSTLEVVLHSGYRVCLSVPFQVREGEGHCFHDQVAPRHSGTLCDLHLVLVEALWVLETGCQHTAPKQEAQQIYQAQSPCRGNLRINTPILAVLEGSMIDPLAYLSISDAGKNTLWP